MVFGKNKKGESQHLVVSSIDQKSEFGPSDAEKRKFSKKIILWYNENKRNLPWRTTKDPYKIWLSEIILQQTRVTQGLPYYLKFVKQFPTVFSLAKAKEQDVLSLWQGLGYYTRARNLHRCAKEVVEKFSGQFPHNFHDLQRLHGIGSYTAAAIASICFGEPVAVVDGNVFRVLSRVFGIDKDISQSKTKDFFFALANELISHDHPDEFNQGVMEFGATHCLPKNPLCIECIFSKQCIANKYDLQSVIPVKSKKQKIRKRYFYYFVSHKNKKIGMKKRIEKDIWHGLFDFYLIETVKPESIVKLIEKDENLREYRLTSVSKTYRHILSHQYLVARFISVNPASKPKRKFENDFRYYSSREIERLPKPVLILQYLRDEGIVE